MLNKIDLTRVDLNLLVLFDVVFKELHVGRAARRLHLSPSAVSHGLTRLRRLLNDPLFLRTPTGVVPSARARELEQPIADVLARIGSIVDDAGSFDPSTARRRFTLGAPDGIAETLLAPLVTCVRELAPGVDVGVRELLPSEGGLRIPARFWDSALAALDAHIVDVAALPIDSVPARFATKTLYEDDFVIAARAGHPLARRPTLEHFANMQHVVVSLAADPVGFVDEALARAGLTRRVALTVPSFLAALAIVRQSDLVAAVPRRFALQQAGHFSIRIVEPPIALMRYTVRAVVPRVALMDDGIGWFFDTLVGIWAEKNASPAARRQ